MVLVDELVNQYKQLHINTDREHIARDVIQEQAPPDHDFLSCKHTVEFMKEAVYYSDFTGRAATSYEDWYDIAHEKVKEILAPKHGDGEESQTVAERLAAVEARVNEDDVTWRKGKDCWWESYIQDI
jgi:trimethylamine:corrinoid methyltransferase-like protein